MFPNDNVIVGAKVDQLFGTRLLFEHCEQMAPHVAETLLPMLRRLQLAVYRLDKYFERNWNLDDMHLTDLWSGIFFELEQITEKRHESETLVRDIRFYQRLEESIRDPFKLGRVKLLDYYSLKTCDVRLARNLIAARAEVSSQEADHYLQAWGIFDLISEVCDDLLDIDEDLSSFNGNRFLLGVGEAGAYLTLAEYRRFESFLTSRLEQLSRRLGSRCRAAAPLAWASQRLIEVQDLLSARGCDSKSLNAAYEGSPLALVVKAGPDWLAVAGIASQSEAEKPRYAHL